jgi:hypothetical protein
MHARVSLREKLTSVITSKRLLLFCGKAVLEENPGVSCSSRRSERENLLLLNSSTAGHGSRNVAASTKYRSQSV